MTAVLVTALELQNQVGAAATDRAELQSILDDLELSLLRVVGRQNTPWLRAQSGVTEVHTGNGSRTLWLHYPIATVTTVTLGRDTAQPDLTLDPADVDELVWGVGLRRIDRIGGVWGRRGSPRYVHVTYDAQDDLPKDAHRAVLLAAAAQWQQKGVEGIKRLSELGASVEYRGGGETGQSAGVVAWDPALVQSLRTYRTIGQ